MLLCFLFYSRSDLFGLTNERTNALRFAETSQYNGFRRSVERGLQVVDRSLVDWFKPATARHSLRTPPATWDVYLMHDTEKVTEVKS